jgi:transcriptional regulator with XRE-family HTH domain
MKRILRSEEQILFQALLKEARASAGFTQADLAEILGRPQSFVAKYETGERMVNVVELMFILNSLGQSPEIFIKKLHSQMTHVGAFIDRNKKPPEFR